MNAIFQDGQIDYGEFVAMMRMGNGGGGRRTMRSIINWEDAVESLEVSSIEAKRH